MAFHFSLASLLRLWQSRQQYERRKLEALAARLGALRAERRRAERVALASRRETAERLSEGSVAAELHYATMREENRRSYLSWLEEQVKAAESAHHSQMAVYQTVDKQCKIVESLRRRQLEAFRQEETRREQKQLDENFLLGRAHAERGNSETRPNSN